MAARRQPGLGRVHEPAVVMRRVRAARARAAGESQLPRLGSFQTEQSRDAGERRPRLGGRRPAAGAGAGMSGSSGGRGPGAAPPPPAAYEPEYRVPTAFTNLRNCFGLGRPDPGIGASAGCPVGRQAAELEDHAHAARLRLADEVVVRGPGASPSSRPGWRRRSSPAWCCRRAPSCASSPSTLTTSTPSASSSSSAFARASSPEPRRAASAWKIETCPLLASAGGHIATKRDGCEDECQEASSHGDEGASPKNHA